MSKQTAINVLFIVFCVLFFLPIYNNVNLDDLRKNMIVMVGCGTIFVMAITQQYRKLSNLFLPGIVLATTIPAIVLNWVDGYTVFWLYYMIGAIGISLYTFFVDEKYVVTALLAMAICQIAIEFIFGVKWYTDYGRVDDQHCLGWGSVRHSIRYSTILYGGFIATWYWIRKLQSRWKLLLLIPVMAFLFFIFKSYSNTIMAITVVSLGIMIGKKFGKYGIISFLTFIVFLYVFIRPSGFGLDGDRAAWWPFVWKEILANKMQFLFGHGLYSWYLNCASAHPHCELFHFIYEFGLFSTILIVGAIMLLGLCSMSTFWVFIGFGGVTSSFLTNSARYPDMTLIWMIFLGLTFKQFQTKALQFENS